MKAFRFSLPPASDVDGGALIPKREFRLEAEGASLPVTTPAAPEPGSFEVSPAVSQYLLRELQSPDSFQSGLSPY